MQLRNTLPIPGRESRTRTTNWASNVLIVLIDDMGFEATSEFGGQCETPTLERLAADGLSRRGRNLDAAQRDPLPRPMVCGGDAEAFDP